MKKIYSIMLALFATLCVGTAYAEDPITLTINVDNPNAIELKMTEGNGEKTLPLVAGDNVITVPYAPEYYSYEILKVNINSGYLVDSLTVSPEEAPTWEDYTRWGGGYELSTDADCAGAVYSFHTTNLNLLRQDTVVVIIDNPSKVKVMYYGSGQIDITDDTTIVAYCSDPDETRLQDLPLTVRAMNPYQGDLIYKVFLNSDEVTKVSEYGDDYYPFNTLAKNDTIRVLTEAPADLVVPAILNLDEVAKEALDSVMVNGVKVALKDTLLVPWGKKIELAFNVDDYKVTANNTPLNNYSNPYSATVTDTTIIKVTAEKYVKYDVTVILHDYTCFQYLYVDNYIYLEKDTTILTMSSKSPRVTVYAADECLLDSIKWNGSVQSGATITCDAEGTLEVWAHKIVRNEKFMLYVERDSMSSMSMSSTHRHYFIDYYNPLTTDYTEFAFSVADDNPISASFRAKSGNKAVCYQNDSILTPNWDGYKLTLADNDVVKVFADTAEVYTVEFVLHGEATTSNVTKDRIVAVEGTNFTVLQGTEVSFETTDTTILVNGEAVKAVEGVVTLTITANTTIEVGVKPSIANTAENPYTIAKAIELTKAGVALEDTVFVIGVVKNIGTKADKIEQYGNVDVYLTDGELEYQFRYMLNVGGAKFANIDEVNATFTSGDTLIAKGTLTYYEAKDMYQLNQYCQLVEVRKSTAEPEPEPEPELVSCVVANAAEDGVIVALNEVVVAYANGMNNFIQDGEGWTLLYVKDAGLKAGDRVSGIKGEIDIYNGIHEVVPSNMGEWTVTAGEAPAPAVQEAALTTTDINHFIKLESVALNGAFTQENNYTVEGTWKGEKVAIYDKFKTNASFAEGLYDVVGVVSIFKNNLQVYFISAEAQAEGIFNASVEAKAEKFVRDGQLIIRMNGVEYNVLGAKIQ